MFGQYPYAPKLIADYLTALLPGVRVCTRIPSERTGMVVQIGMVQAAVHAGGGGADVLAWRRLIFTCLADNELAGGQLCERVRSLVMAARYPTRSRPAVIRNAQMIGEPARVDLRDEPTPRHQTTIDVLLRETYRAA